MDLFTKLGRWIAATLRGSENGGESGTLHVLKTDSSGRLEVTPQPVTSVLTGYDYAAATQRTVAVDANGKLCAVIAEAEAAPAAFYHCEVGYDFSGQVYSNSHIHGLPLLADNYSVIGLHRFRITAALAATGSVRLRAIVVSPAATGNIYRSCDAYWGNIGEDFDTHTASVAGGAAAIAYTDHYTAVVDTTLTPISAGDIVVVLVMRDSSDALDTIDETVYLQGVIIEPA